MAFHNVRLSTRVEVNARGGPGFKTSIVETASGDEFRNINWSRQRGRWEVGYTDDHRIIEELIAFFHVRRGRAYGFRFRDWSDYKVDNDFAVGDGTTKTFQAAKVYRSGNDSFSRALTRLVAPVEIRVTPQTGEDELGNPVYGSPQVVSVGVNVNINSGAVTFGTAPAPGSIIGIKCQFDVPVRFDVDDLPIVMITQDISQIESVPLIEIRDRGEQS